MWGKEKTWIDVFEPTSSPPIYVQCSLEFVKLRLTKRLGVQNFLVWINVIAFAISSR